jgi:lysophospholipase L1-like esterase
MKYIIISVIIILAFFELNKSEIETVKLTQNDSILAMGDSLTYGFGADPKYSYPKRLSTLTNLNVINTGINGDTSQDGLRRLPSLLNDSSIKLMILCFGGNDILQKKSMVDLKDNLKKMITLAKAKNIDVLLISVPNISLFGLSSLELYEEVAEEENVHLISGLLADVLSQASLKSDQIHPNAQGYKVMSEKIFEALKEYGWVGE